MQYALSHQALFAIFRRQRPFYAGRPPPRARRQCRAFRRKSQQRSPLARTALGRALRLGAPLGAPIGPCVSVWDFGIFIGYHKGFRHLSLYHWLAGALLGQLVL